MKRVESCEGRVSLLEKFDTSGTRRAGFLYIYEEGRKKREKETSSP